MAFDARIGDCHAMIASWKAIEKALIRHHPLTLPGGDTLRLHLVQFAAAQFDPSSFAMAGIACPPAIARSVPKRQAEFFYGRLAAHAALRDFGTPAQEIPVGAGREPVWPVDVVGSISHTAGLAGAVAGARARHRGLGIDLERTARGQSQAALRQTVIDADELSYLRAASGTLTLDELVTLVFSAKESLYKAAYGTVRSFFGYEAARVAEVDEPRGIVTLVLAEDLHPEFARGRVCAIAFERLDRETFVTAFEATPEGTASDKTRAAHSHSMVAGGLLDTS